jgi:hypothetical protein
MSDEQILDLTPAEFEDKLGALGKVIEYETLIIAGGISKAFGGGGNKSDSAGDDGSNAAAVRQMESVGIKPPSKY